MRLKYYYATIYDSIENRMFTILDCYSHPFIWLEIQHELGRTHFRILNWRELTEEEFNYYPRPLLKFGSQSKVDELMSRASEFAGRRFTKPYDDLIEPLQMQHEWFVIGFQEALSELKKS